MKNLTQDRWQQIDSLFDKALEQSPEERQTFIQKACRTDSELFNHLEKLLQMHGEAEKLIGESATTFAAPLIPGLIDQLPAKEEETPGTRVGPYEILEEIGYGGMGAVYLAQKKDTPYEKQVALKLIRRGMDTRDVLRRFRNEGQILASLEHPNIARLYDGGVHSDGRPFFVMEYIEGKSINEYCDRHKLSIKERIKLFRTVCEAVHYAHQALIVHRDIKPANVLVTSDGTIKLVDFGIAKLLEPDRMDLTGFHTQTGMKLMTPEFAAPEQIRGNPVTTASDIYSLGVLLYLLLTGRKPYRLGTSSMLEIERIVCETAPVRPSDAAAGKSLPAPSDDEEDPFVPATEAGLRAKDVGSLIRELSGDLDRVILKALRKEPERRYRSALAFAEDIDNYLQGKPVQARPSTLLYRARKFAGRNKGAVLAAVVAFFSILVGLVAVLWQADIARMERDIAQNEAAKARAAQDYLVELFEAADPAENQGNPLTVQEIVQRGIDQLEENLGAEPEVHIEMLKVLGRVEQALGDFDLSAELLEEALTKTRELRGNEHLDVAVIAAMLGEVLRWDGEFERAESLQREALEIRRSFIAGDNAEIAINMDRLARTLEMKGELEESELLYNQALAMRERLFGENSDAVAANLNNLGWLLYQMGKTDEAEQALRKSLGIKDQIMEPPNPAISSTLSNLAVVLRAKGDYLEAEEFAEQALRQEIELYGDDHPRVTTALNNQTLILRDLGHYEEVTKNYRLILENNRRQLGPTHLYVGFALSGLGKSLVESGQSEESLPLYEEALEIFRNSVGDDHRYYAKSLALKGEALYYQDLQQAESVLEQALEITVQAVGRNHPDFTQMMTSLGRIQFAAGKIETAAATLSEALSIQQQILPDANANTAWILVNLGKVLTATGALEEAEQRLQKAVEISSESLPPDHWQHIAAQLELAACRLAGGQETAREKLEDILAALQGRTDFHAVRLQKRALDIQNRIAG